MENLKNLRKQKNLTQEELARLLNISRTTYVGYERNTSEPNLEFLFKLADFYNVSLDYLCGRPNSNLIFTDSLTDTQKKLVELIKMLSNDQALIALGYFSDMLKIPYSEVRPARPF